MCVAWAERFLLLVCRAVSLVRSFPQCDLGVQIVRAEMCQADSDVAFDMHSSVLAPTLHSTLWTLRPDHIKLHNIGASIVASVMVPDSLYHSAIFTSTKLKKHVGTYVGPYIQ